MMWMETNVVLSTSPHPACDLLHSSTDLAQLSIIICTSTLSPAGVVSAGEQLWVVLAEAGLVSGVASSLHILSLGLASLAQLLRIELMILHKADN